MFFLFQFSFDNYWKFLSTSIQKSIFKTKEPCVNVSDRPQYKQYLLPVVKILCVCDAESTNFDKVSPIFVLYSQRRWFDLRPNYTMPDCFSYRIASTRNEKIGSYTAPLRLFLRSVPATRDTLYFAIFFLPSNSQ